MVNELPLPTTRKLKAALTIGCEFWTRLVIYTTTKWQETLNERVSFDFFTAPALLAIAQFWQLYYNAYIFLANTRRIQLCFSFLEYPLRFASRHCWPSARKREETPNTISPGLAERLLRLLVVGKHFLHVFEISALKHDYRRQRKTVNKQCTLARFDCANVRNPTRPPYPLCHVRI